MNKATLIALLLLAILSSSCSKKTVPALATVGPAKLTLNIETIDFDYFQGKARMILRDGSKERDVKANIRIRKDSVIWMTFSVIGVQGGKALINKDSITVVSNLDKEYYVFEYGELSRRFNFEINYQVIQAAMLGNPIMARANSDDVEQANSMFLLKQKQATVAVINYINAASMKIEKVEMSETDSKNSLTLNYANFQPLEHRLFPYNGTISLLYKTPAGLLNTTIIFEYNKATVDEKELKFPFNIPKKYVRR